MNNPPSPILIFLEILAIVVGFGGIAVIVALFFRFKTSKKVVSERLQDLQAGPLKQRAFINSERVLPREITGSFFSRTIKPFFQKIISLIGRLAPGSTIQKIEHQLTVAGNPLGLHAQAFYGLKILFFIIGIGLAVLVNIGNNPINIMRALLGIVIVLYAAYVPGAWLKSQMKNRQDEIRRNLPDALDMLSVCASAGMGFDQSLRRICEFWPSTLGSEFLHAVQEMDIGVSRADALRNMCGRLDVDELSSFVAIINQAETIGMSFSDVLHSQAKQMRILRQYKAREIANKMPARMIVPVALLIFPALLAVFAGPMVPTLLEVFNH